jgi:hypothetical protein
VPHLLPARSSRPVRLAAGAACLVQALLGPAAAEEIAFDDLPAANANCCYLAGEYADLGVRFETTDDGSVWGGMVAGDPGEWRLNGTAGPAFLGFNGRSYDATVHFEEPVVGVSIDAARAYGSTGYAELRVWGLVEGEIVERAVVPLLAVNTWVTASLESEVDAVRWKVLGDSGFRPYGVDRLRWEWAAPPEPEILEVEIDVLPFRRHNAIPRTSRGLIPILLFGSEGFAVEDVDPETLAFGPAGAPALGRWYGPHQIDQNRDGLFDLLLFVRPDALEVGRGDACLTGETFEGLAFAGCDDLEIVEPRSRGRGHKYGHAKQLDD